MLPEPDLFAGVNAIRQNNACSQKHQGNSSIVPSQTVNSFPTQDQDRQKSELSVPNIKLMCQAYNWRLANGFSKQHHLNRTAGVDIIDPLERRARCRYLTVIVLLYAGFITSVCLNVSLLLQSYPDEPSPLINPFPPGFGLDEVKLSAGN